MPARERHVTSSSDPDHVSTPHVERQNLTTAMNMRRFTGLTNAFSKLENHAHPVALHFMYYPREPGRDDACNGAPRDDEPLGTLTTR